MVILAEPLGHLQILGGLIALAAITPILHAQRPPSGVSGDA
jgi:hypothetical protein